MKIQKEPFHFAGRFLFLFTQSFLKLFLGYLYQVGVLLCKEM